MSLDIWLRDENENEIFSQNITHNLNKMAEEAGIYNCVWRPDEHGYNKASDIISDLRIGIARMATAPTHYKQFDSPNGWGLYEHFMPWLIRYLEACEKNPDAWIGVSR